MMRPLRLLACAAVPTLLAAACGSPVSGLPPDLALNEMSEEQAVQMCEAFEEYGDNQISEDELKAIACAFGATFAAAAADEGEELDACQAAYDECFEAEPDEAEEPVEVDCSEARAPSDCTATTLEVEECYVDRITALKEAAASVSCEAIVEDLDSEEEAEDDEPASCEDLDASCFALVTDEPADEE